MKHTSGMSQATIRPTAYMAPSSSISESPRAAPFAVTGVVLIVANFVTAGIGTALPGLEKLSLSNLLPMLFVAVFGTLFLASRETMPRKLAAFLLAFNASVLLSFTIFMLRDQWSPNLVVLFFQDVELLFCLLLCWYERDDPAAFRDAVKIGLYAVPLVAGIYGLQELRDGIVLMKFGMDDKSHAAILLSMASFLLIRFHSGIASRVVAIALLLMALMTASRLPVLFVPAVTLALVVRSRHRGAVLLSLGLSLILLLHYYGDILLRTFTVAQRLASVQAISGEDSTSSHIKLIQAAWEMKISDPWYFLFGIGPSNFSKALTSAPDLLDRVAALDPTLVVAAMKGQAPVHSTQMAIFLDYPIWIFVLYFLCLLKVVQYLAARRQYTDMLFVAALLGSSAFYTLHNKPYFFLCVTCYGLLLLREPAAPANPMPSPTARASNSNQGAARKTE
ncbi:MAG: hypothetical protein WDO12_13905 [Pseudomonadota bacterium]